ncbi:MAG: hypothetical protein CO189_03220 [candidate division Zixibacteria bacterium CG_4_9_14_3_um_filter_46_8]|nr:MAG: hypothetical protein CO189_03220 [candidate division Zixibacteria bacterium CG_4_9_14_3_um_filter_46_8]
MVTLIPMLMAVGPLIGYLIGSYLDKKLGTAPYLMIVMIIFGFVASGKEIYNMIKRLQQDTENK